jgi:hypothetical protein
MSTCAPQHVTGDLGRSHGASGWDRFIRRGRRRLAGVPARRLNMGTEAPLDPPTTVGCGGEGSPAWGPGRGSTEQRALTRVKRSHPGTWGTWGTSDASPLPYPPTVDERRQVPQVPRGSRRRPTAWGGGASGGWSGRSVPSSRRPRWQDRRPAPGARRAPTRAGGIGRMRRAGPTCRHAGPPVRAATRGLEPIAQPGNAAAPASLQCPSVVGRSAQAQGWPATRAAPAPAVVRVLPSGVRRSADRTRGGRCRGCQPHHSA